MDRFWHDSIKVTFIKVKWKESTRLWEGSNHVLIVFLRSCLWFFIGRNEAQWLLECLVWYRVWCRSSSPDDMTVDGSL